MTRAARRQASRTGTALTALLSQGLILASGADAPTFLQGQLSNDITQVSRSRAQLAAYCTPKGRVLATLLLWKTDNGYALELPRELCEPIRKRLQMYVLRSRVQLADVSDQTALIGLVGADALAVVRSELGLALGLGLRCCPRRRRCRDRSARHASAGDRRHRAWGRDLGSSRTPLCMLMGEEIWDAQTVAAGIPAITTATQDQFTPHMLNLDLVGGVSFDKGCYTGQEIVARTQYLGQVKRRLARFATTARAVAGTVVYADAAPGGNSGQRRPLASRRIRAARGDANARDASWGRRQLRCIWTLTARRCGRWPCPTRCPRHRDRSTGDGD